MTAPRDWIIPSPPPPSDSSSDEEELAPPKQFSTATHCARTPTTVTRNKAPPARTTPAKWAVKRAPKPQERTRAAPSSGLRASTSQRKSHEDSLGAALRKALGSKKGREVTRMLEDDDDLFGDGE